MMRFFMVAGVLLTAAVASPLTAQTVYDDPGRYNVFMLQAEMAQREALAAQQAADAAQARLETETRLNALSLQRTTGQSAIRQSSVTQGADIGAQMNADSARLSALTDAALARSNARVMAVRPTNP
jgi:hypothetical protein